MRPKPLRLEEAPPTGTAEGPYRIITGQPEEDPLADCFMSDLQRRIFLGLRRRLVIEGLALGELEIRQYKPDPEVPESARAARRALRERMRRQRLNADLVARLRARYPDREDLKPPGARASKVRKLADKLNAFPWRRRPTPLPEAPQKPATPLKKGRYFGIGLGSGHRSGSRAPPNEHR